MYASEPTRRPASGLLEAALVKEISMIIGRRDSRLEPEPATVI